MVDDEILIECKICDTKSVNLDDMWIIHFGKAAKDEEEEKAY